MALYIKIPKQNPFYGSFKDRYLELTDEKIQDSPLENEQRTHYLVGSSRLSPEIADQLISEFPQVSIRDSWPIGWVTKLDEI